MSRVCGMYCGKNHEITGACLILQPVIFICVTWWKLVYDPHNRRQHQLARVLSCTLRNPVHWFLKPWAQRKACGVHLLNATACCTHLSMCIFTRGHTQVQWSRMPGQRHWVITGKWKIGLTEEEIPFFIVGGTQNITYNAELHWNACSIQINYIWLTLSPPLSHIPSTRQVCQYFYIVSKFSNRNKNEATWHCS